MDSRRPQPVGCGGKNDNEGRNVILQRLMPPYRLRQTGESMTLLPAATHIDIAAAMALWIPRHGTSCGEYRRRMTTKNKHHKKSPSSCGEGENVSTYKLRFYS